jgi:chromosome segregation ATPase
MASLSLTIVEIIVLMLGAIVLGITIHFFITSRRNLKNTITSATPSKPQQNLNEWKLKYFNETEIKDKELIALRDRVQEAEENLKIYEIEAEEVKRQNKKLISDLQEAKLAAPTGSTGTQKQDYFAQLRDAQSSMLEHNEKINQLLEQIDVISITEEKHKKMERDNDELAAEIEELRGKLQFKEREISNMQQRANLSKEMSSMLDNAYTEFGSLQDKIQKLESQVNSSKLVSMEYEEIKEEHHKIKEDLEDQRNKVTHLSTENHELKSNLEIAEEKLREVNFQRQQLQKRVSYLEELNQDLQVVSDANKRLEHQIKRIGELESMINMMSEEREEMMRKK